jgi:hypothetical protein
LYLSLSASQNRPRDSSNSESELTGGRAVIRVNEAKDKPKRQENRKYNTVGIADKNK